MGVSLRSGQRADHGRTVSNHRTAAPEKWISTRARTAPRSRIRPCAPAATSCGSDRLPQAGAAAAIEHGLAIGETAVVAGWREARVPALCEAGQTVAVAVLNTDGSGDRVLTLPRDVEMQGSDWSKDGQAILGACRFNRSDRYSTCLVPVSGVNEGGDSPVRVIASDRNAISIISGSLPTSAGSRFSRTTSLRLDVHGLRHPGGGGAWRAITDGAWFDDKPRWGPDGRILYFVSNRTGVANVWGRRFDNSTGTPWRAISRHVVPVRAVRVDAADRPDGYRDHGDHLLLPMSESRSDIWMLDQIDR